MKYGVRVVYLGLLQGQLAISVVSGSCNLHCATGVQDAGVLEDLYSYKGKLGVIFRRPKFEGEFREFRDEPEGDIRIKVWAATADDEASAIRDGDSNRSLHDSKDARAQRAMGGHAAWNLDRQVLPAR